VEDIKKEMDEFLVNPSKRPAEAVKCVYSLVLATTYIAEFVAYAKNVDTKLLLYLQHVVALIPRLDPYVDVGLYRHHAEILAAKARIPSRTEARAILDASSDPAATVREFERDYRRMHFLLLHASISLNDGERDDFLSQLSRARENQKLARVILNLKANKQS
jgi:hypothetical protein